MATTVIDDDKQKEQARKKAAYMKNYRVQNADRIRESQKAYKEKNREKTRENGRKGSKRHYQKDPEARKLAAKISRAKRPDYYRSQHAKANAAWLAKNYEKVRDQRRARRDAINLRTKERRKANPDQFRTYTQNRRARRIQATGTYTREDVADICRHQNGKCAYCKKNIRSTFEVDHIIPLSLGGMNSRRNLQLTCRSCNRRKRAKDPMDFARELGRLL